MKLPGETWNPILLGCGIVGLLFVWLLPWFWLGILVLIVLYLAPTLSYVSLRNEKATPEQRVLTPRHLRSLLRRLLRLELRRAGREGRDSFRCASSARAATRRKKMPAALARLQGSKGYRAALEMIAEASSCAPPTSTWNQPRRR